MTLKTEEQVRQDDTPRDVLQLDDKGADRIKAGLAKAGAVVQLYAFHMGVSSAYDLGQHKVESWDEILEAADAEARKMVEKGGGYETWNPWSILVCPVKPKFGKGSRALGLQAIWQVKDSFKIAGGC